MPAPRACVAAVDQLGIAEHPSFLVQRAQLARIDLDEHALAVHDLRIELDRHAPLAQHHARRLAHVAPARLDDVLDHPPTPPPTPLTPPFNSSHSTLFPT